MGRPLRLLVAYDGTGFCGFQIQPGRRTVQGVLAEALSQLARRPVAVRGAGRTDAGVHALGQVVSLDPLPIRPEALLRAAAGILPPDVGILDAAEGPEGFDARRSALWRAYAYLIWNAPAPHPMLGRYALWVRQPLDDAAFAEALAVVVGTHDFRSFARLRPGQAPVRTVLEATATREGPLVRVRVVGDAFLHQMVRSVVGSALQVAAGRRPVSWMRRALLAADRSAAGPVAPPHGLALTEVGYEGAPWPRSPGLPWPWAAAGGGVPIRALRGW